MSKFRIKLKLQGLEIEVEGSREDAPMIASNLGRQFAGLLQPAAQIIEGEVIESVPVNRAGPTIPVEGTARKKVSRRKHAVASTGDAGGEDSDVPLDWRHDPSKWGSPKQEWNTATKAIWLLYVASKETEQKELSARRIAATFNKHFKQAGQVLGHNVVRDLGKLKVGKDAPVSEDTTQPSSPWFLTDAGIRKAEGLVAEALGRTSDAGSEG